MAGCLELWQGFMVLAGHATEHCLGFPNPEPQQMSASQNRTAHNRASHFKAC